MTINEFNSKINLPALCLHRGYRGLEYVKLPKFGWFAFNKDRSVVHNVMSLGNWAPSQAYQYLTKDHPEFQESRLVYSETSERKLAADATRLAAYKALYSIALDEMEMGRIRTPFGKAKVRSVLEQEGLPKFRENMIGMVTSRALTNEHLGYTIGDKFCDRFIVASFCTPFHPCSFESVNPFKLEDTEEMMTFGERGWYGVLDKVICTGINEFGATVGNTWDKKVDYWQQKIVDLSPNLDEKQCLQIWVEAKNSRFTQNPIDIIVQNNKIEEIRHFLKELNLPQIRELEKLTDTNLFNHWKKSKQEEITVGGIKFIQRDFRYYFIQGEGLEVEYTNFTINITTIKKVEDKYVYCCNINHNGTEVAAEIPQASFRSSYVLSNWLRDFFLVAGMGIPLITPTYKQYLLYIIQKFSENALVDNTIPVS